MTRVARARQQKVFTDNILLLLDSADNFSALLCQGDNSQFTPLTLSTEEVLEEISHSRFDAIISEMRRPPDQCAGYTLLNELRSQGDQTPFIIYTGSRAPEHIVEAKKRGALGTTNRPDELLGMVVKAIGLE